MTLPVGQFHRNSSLSDGRAFYCRKCMAKYARDWYARTQRPKVAMRQREVEKARRRIRNATKKECTKCREILFRSAFSRNKGNLDGLQDYCRTCMAEYQQQYYQDNPHKCQQRKHRQREWQRNLSPEKKRAASLRALLRRHNLTNEEHAALYEACDHRCQVCKLHATENTWKGLSGQLCIDHVDAAGKPVVRGLLCNRCNSLLGRMGDDREGVMRYVDYLRRYQGSKTGN
jgi:hypothetical protein